MSLAEVRSRPDGRSAKGSAAPLTGVNDALTPNRTAARVPGDRRPAVENSAYAEMMRRMIRALGRRVADGDVEDLAEMIELRNLLEEEMGRAARSLNEQGESWARIGRGAGLSKQGAQQRWGRPT